MIIKLFREIAQNHKRPIGENGTRIIFHVLRSTVSARRNDVLRDVYFTELSRVKLLSRLIVVHGFTMFTMEISMMDVLYYDVVRADRV